MRITVTRQIEVPDPVKLERLRSAPQFGPKVLFFSGGTALKQTSRELVAYTHNSIHIVTPFDSGGSSAELRRAFAMPAVGDIRNRLMALADQTIQGAPEIYDLFAYRLDKNPCQDELRRELASLSSGHHRLMRRVPDPMRKILRNHCRDFQAAMPADFDLRGASVGNLVLTAGYLSSHRQFDAVIYLFSKLVAVRGVVRPVVNKNLHLAVRLDDGQVVTGQHRITGKQGSPLTSRIKDLWLTNGPDESEPAEAAVRAKITERIREAELICYPMGSFYSSLIANLLPAGVGRAVAANPCPKLFIPSTSGDPELIGVPVADQADMLIRRLCADSGQIRPDQVLGYVLADVKNGSYPGIDPKALAAMGLTLIDCPLVTRQSAPLLDAKLLAQAIISLT